MGYESKLYIVDKALYQKRTFEDGKTRCWAQVIATFDLSKVYDVSDEMRKYADTDCYIYADDGNTEILEDCYGQALKEIPIKDAIRIIETAAKDSDYRRFDPCIALLRAFDVRRWDNLVVLHYGH